MVVKISQEANQCNLKQLTEMQKRYKQIEETTKKLLATPVEEQQHTVLPAVATYRTGHGDTISPVREEGLQHKQYKSKGTLCNVLLSKEVDK